MQQGSMRRNMQHSFYLTNICISQHISFQRKKGEKGNSFLTAIKMKIRPVSFKNHGTTICRWCVEASHSQTVAARTGFCRQKDKETSEGKKILSLVDSSHGCEQYTDIIMKEYL